MTDAISDPKVRQLLENINTAELRNGLLTLSASKSAAQDFVNLLREVVEARARQIGDKRRNGDDGLDPDRVELKSDQLGKVVWTRVADGPGVTDEQAFGRWVVTNYPSEVTVKIVLQDPRDLLTPDGMNGDESVELRLAGGYKHEQVDLRPIPYTVEYDIRGQWQARFLDNEVKIEADGTAIDKDTGEVVPGVGRTPKAGGLRVYANDDAKHEARAAFRSMALQDALKQLPPVSADFAAATPAVVDVELPDPVGDGPLDPLAGLGGTLVVDDALPPDLAVASSGPVTEHAKVAVIHLGHEDEAQASPVRDVSPGPDPYRNVTPPVSIECANCSAQVHQSTGRSALKVHHNGSAGQGSCAVPGCSCKRFKRVGT